MKTRSKLFLILSIILSNSAIRAQNVPPADSAINAISQISPGEFRIYPLNSPEQMLQLKAPVYMFGNQCMLFGFQISEENLSMDGMDIRDKRFIGSPWVSTLNVDNGNFSLFNAFSPLGRYDFRTDPVTSPPSFKADFRGTVHGLQSSIQFSNQISRHEGDTHPIRIDVMGYVNSSIDGGPSFTENYSISRETKNTLMLTPFVFRPSTYDPVYGTYYLAKDQWTKNKFDENARQKQMMLYCNAKIPLSASDELHVQALYSDENGKVARFNNRLFNSGNNPDFRNRYFDTKISFDHNIVNFRDIKLNYHLSLAYDNLLAKQGNDKYGEDYFRYCYIGSYTDQIVPEYYLTQQGGVDTYTQTGFHTTAIDFVPGGMNTGLESYVSQINESSDPSPLRLDNYRNGYIPSNIWPGWSNYGVPVSEFSQTQRSRKSFSGFVNAEKKRNMLMLGFSYRNDVDRNLNVQADNLYSLVRSLVNRQLQYLDTDHPVFETRDGKQYITYGRMNNHNVQSEYDRNLRGLIGLPVDGNELILIDSYNYETHSIQYYDNKNQLQSKVIDGNPYDINLIGAGELIPAIHSTGYDLHGDKIKHSHNPLSLAEDGAQIPYSPVNMAMWLNYSRDIKRLKINAGIRLERFDARQPVLSDPLSFYPLKSVAETPEMNHNTAAHPDWLVYVDMNNGASVVAYRDGSNWYNPEGKTINESDLVVGKLIPVMKNPLLTGLQNIALSDYKAVTNLLPAADLEFAITSQLTAGLRYNSYTRNPVNNIFDSYQYAMYLNYASDQFGNPALVPERFDRMQLSLNYKGAQGLSASISGEMLEYRNALQLVMMRMAYPVSYYSYRNNPDVIKIPSATVRVACQKFWWEGGFTYSHIFLADNLSIQQISDKSVYNLYFSTSRDLATVYASLKMHRKLEGLSLGGVCNFRGGTSYLVKKESLYTGASDLMPSSATLDVKLRYMVKILKGEMGVAFYVQAMNVLNVKRIYSVYGTTGLPDDDGFLSSAMNQYLINSSHDPQALRDQYSLYINNPDFYAPARSLWAGITLMF